ncbi:pseudaminic acid cytidylyltransferase [Thiomicrorhabdus indica]|uniref:pseudaminic acid cytidylyltransferase n=1 Tax=Thiomicrorhabdus indica TaxID=2267253 RepID=UPI002AA68226|nr:pseudaminic acid cytidylyltransferase [Thiomicrorhabdus indica]
MNIAIIPARGGSKRIPKKNIKEFCGKPMISHAIAIIKDSGLFDEIVVSTDCNEIAQIALQSGATRTLSRPKALADDYAPTIPVIQHAIEQLPFSGIKSVCCVYSTAVFLTPEILQQAHAFIDENNADFVMPVVAYSCPFERALKLNQQGFLSMKNLENLNQRTQDCEILYHDVGQFYFGSIAAWKEPGQFYDKRVKAISIPKYRAHDIDTPEDWILAEMVFNQLDKLL